MTTLAPAHVHATLQASSVHPEKPQSITIIKPAHIAFQEAVVHARNGYNFLPGVAPEVMAFTGMALIHMVLGSPEQYAEDEAKNTIAETVEKERYDYQKGLELSVKQHGESQRREEITKQLMVVKADHARAVKKLEKEFAASQSATAALR